MSALPEGWELRRNEEGRPYYVNHKMQTTQWDPPHGLQGPPSYGPPGGYQQPGYPQPGYSQPGYPSPQSQGYAPPGGYPPPPQQQRYATPPQQGYGAPPPQSYPSQPQQPQKQNKGTGKFLAGAAIGAVAGLAGGAFLDHEIEKHEREDEGYYRGGGYGGGYGGGFGGGGYGGPGYGGDTTIINEDGGFFGSDKQTIIQTDGDGDTTIVQQDDGWFHDTTEVTTIDNDGDVYREEDSSWF